MLSNANFLILDEPTNHLDITSKEILENAINNYEGTILYVSHDRYFINKTATRIIDLVNKKLVNYLGNYDYYLEKKDELTKVYAAADATSADTVNVQKETSENKLSWQQMKEEQAKERKKQNELKKLETRINELETRQAELNEEMANPEISSNVGKLTEITKEMDKITEELDSLYEKWEEYI